MPLKLSSSALNSGHKKGDEHKSYLDSVASGRAQTESINSQLQPQLLALLLSSTLTSLHNLLKTAAP